jgi:hypothetical protein
MLFLWCCYNYYLFCVFDQRLLLNPLSERQGESCRFCYCSCLSTDGPLLLSLLPLLLLLLQLLLNIDCLAMRLWKSLGQVSHVEAGRHKDNILEAGQKLRGKEPIHCGMLHKAPGISAPGHTPELLPDAGGYALIILLQIVSYSPLRYVEMQDVL